jgi:hypothetical protein
LTRRAVTTFLYTDEPHARLTNDEVSDQVTDAPAAGAAASFVEYT